MGNPVDEYLESCAIEKTANFGADFGKGVRESLSGKGLGELAAYTGVSIAGSALIAAARKAYGAATKSRDYTAMLEVNPDLVEHQEANPRMFNQHYNSLRQLNPTFAADPVVAGSYMRQMSEMPHNAGNVLVNSIGAAPKSPQGGMRDLATGIDLASRAKPPSEIDRYKVDEAKAKAHKAQREAYPPDDQE